MYSGFQPNHRSQTHSILEELVYFAVTNVECRSPTNGHALGFSEMSVGFTSGELGCWVDATETRMVQTGVEHARIPDAAAYMGGYPSRRAFVNGYLIDA